MSESMRITDFNNKVLEVGKEIAKRLNLQFDADKLHIVIEDDGKGNNLSIEYNDVVVHAYVGASLIGDEFVYDICDTTIFFLE